MKKFMEKYDLVFGRKRAEQPPRRRCKLLLFTRCTFCEEKKKKTVSLTIWLSSSEMGRVFLIENIGRDINSLALCYA